MPVSRFRHARSISSSASPMLVSASACALMALIPRGLPPVEVQCFGAAVDATGLGVRFDAAARVGKLDLFHLWDTYYPFKYGR